MTWNALANGCCPPAPPEFRFVNVTSGQVNQAAIDNQGRLFTWGNTGQSSTGQTPIPSGVNFLMHPAVFLAPTLEEMRYPYQVGTKSDWVRVEAAEYLYMAIDAEGVLWAWGEGFAGQGGWDVTDQYVWNRTTDRWEPNNTVAIVPQLVDAGPWEDFALGWYHVVGLKADNSLWIWGTNYDNTFGDPGYTPGQVSLVPIEVTWIPEGVKLVSADYSVTAIVTVTDKVYVWGDFTFDANIPTPTQVPITLPAGVTITSIKCDYGGVVILLSNGQAYGYGSLAPVIEAPYYSSEFVLISETLSFIRIDCDNLAGGAIDNTGQLWVWGITGAGNYKLSRNTLVCDDDWLTIAINANSTEPVFAASDTIGQYQWHEFDLGGWTHVLIDSAGRLRTYGLNAHAELGIDLSQNELNHSCSPVFCAPILDSTGEDATILPAVGTPSTSPNCVIEWQANYPGLQVSQKHFHFNLLPENQLGGGESVPLMCCDTTIAVEGVTVFFVCMGRYFPQRILPLVYASNSNTWSLLDILENRATSNWNAGLSLRGGVYGFHNYAYVSAGVRFNETFSDPGMLTIIWTGTEARIKTWPGYNELDGIGKIAVNNNGTIAVIVLLGTDILVEISTDYGDTYTTENTFDNTGNIYVDYRLAMDDDGDIYVVLLRDGNGVDEFVLLEVYHSDDAGTTWDSVLSFELETNPITRATRLEFSVDDVLLFCTVQTTITTTFYYSSDFGASWTAVELEVPSTHYAATGTKLYNLNDGTDYYTSDYTPDPVVWTPNNTVETIATTETNTDKHSQIRNDGLTVVYADSLLYRRTLVSSHRAFMLSTDLGVNWKLIPSPLGYIEEEVEEIINGHGPLFPNDPPMYSVIVGEPVFTPRTSRSFILGDPLLAILQRPIIT